MSLADTLLLLCQPINDSSLALSPDCISKVALNMYNRKLSRELEQVSSATPFFYASFSMEVKEDFENRVLTRNICAGWLYSHFREFVARGCSEMERMADTFCSFDPLSHHCVSLTAPPWLRQGQYLVFEARSLFLLLTHCVCSFCSRSQTDG